MSDTTRWLSATELAEAYRTGELTPDTVAAELLDAIDGDDQENLREELGDLLLQVLFHARIAADDPMAPFDIGDVARSFTEKVRGRTPGVLSGEHADLETQIREWEERKAAEKQRGSVLDGIATTAPALALKTAPSPPSTSRLATPSCSASGPAPKSRSTTKTS